MKQPMLVAVLLTGAVYNFVASLGAALDSDFAVFLAHAALVVVTTGFAIDAAATLALDRLADVVDVVLELTGEDRDDA